MKVHGTMYKRHCALVVGIQIPEFVKDVLVVDDELYFHVNYHAHIFVTRKEYLHSYPTLVTQTTTIYVLLLILTRPGEKAVILKDHISTCITLVILRVQFV